MSTTDVNTPSPEHDPEVARYISELIASLRGFTVANRMWSDLLTEEQRRALGGDLESAFRNGGTVRIWMTVHSLTLPLAVIDLAHKLGLLLPEQFRRLANKLGSAFADDRPGRPHWDKERRELRFNSVVIRRVPRPGAAKNVVSVPDAFEEEGWPARVADPLPNGANSTRLHATIRSLNNGLSKVVFSADGTGQGFAWRLA